MALEGEQGIIAHHAAAVVGDLYELFAAGFDLDFDPCRSRVERILEQLLHHRRWPLDYLASGDLVGNLLGKYVDAAHGGRRSEASFAEGKPEGKSSEPNVWRDLRGARAKEPEFSVQVFRNHDRTLPGWLPEAPPTLPQWSQ